MPIRGTPPARASPLAKLKPMRTPVNDPGPIETLRRSSVRKSSDGAASACSISSNSPTAWLSETRSSLSASTCPSSITPTVAFQVAVSRPRTRTSSPAANDAGDVVVKGERHQRDENHEADLLGDLAGAQVERPANHSFDEKEEEMAAVQHRSEERRVG